MPRTQALSFAIRSRQFPPPTRPTIRSNDHQPASARAYSNTTTKSGLKVSKAVKSSRNIHQDHLSTHRSSFATTRPLPRNGSLPLRTRLLHTLHRRSLSTLPRRPTAPYLDANLHRDPRILPTFRRFIKQRYQSTARRQKYREMLRWQLTFHSYFWPMFASLMLLVYGVQQIGFEHEFPTCREWGFWARWDGRMSQRRLGAISVQGWATDERWRVLGYWLLDLRGRLEDPKGDGKGVREQEVRDGDGVLLVDGVGRLGLNVSEKSASWRHGYYQCLMGLARTAEALDGKCKRRDQELKKADLYLWENIPGPENPRPVPVAWDKGGKHLNVPAMNEVEPAFEGPEVFYLSILTSKGFNNRQRLDAALAYADWCDYKGLKDTAGHMFDWALDIAAGGLPEGQDAAHVVDMQTGVINAGKEQFVTKNLFKATTAMAVWHARNGQVKEALPIFLSILRARKALPPEPAYMQKSRKAKPMTAPERDNRSDGDVLVNYVSSLFDFFREEDTSRIPSSGDERPFHSLDEACEEVGIMTYIGEILFATSGSDREKGLSWTRDSVEAAEAVLWFMDEQGTNANDHGRARCRECLETGLQNWQQMTRQMASLARRREEEVKTSKGWLGLGIGQGSALDKAVADVKRWEEEERQIELRKQKTASLINPLLSMAGENPFSMNNTLRVGAF